MDYFFSVLSTAFIIFIVVMFFNLMIFVHELGHFLAARWRGLYVDRFQIWFGKPLWKKKINGVQWGLGWIPAGGFVSLPQMAPMEAIEGEVDLPKDLKPVSPLDKIIVAAAGPLFSLLLAFFFAFIVWGVGKPEIEMTNTTIGYFRPDSPAAAAGLLPGDKILKIDGHPVERWVGNMEGVRERVMLSEGEKIGFLIQRPGEKEPRLIESGFNIPETKWWQRKSLRQSGFSYAIESLVDHVLPGSPAEKAGLKPGDVLIELDGNKLWSPLTVMDAAEKGAPFSLLVRHSDGKESRVTVTPEIPSNWKGLEKARSITGLVFGSGDSARQVTVYPNPWQQVVQSLKWMKDTVLKIIAPKSDVGMEHLSGPIGIFAHIYNLLVVEQGWKLAMWFAVVLNVNLAVLNMLPFPVVDGGHVVLNFLEIIFRRPIGGRFLEIIQVGFVFVILGFFLFVTSKDFGDLVGSDENKLPDPVFWKS